jgi:hypothetical protein
MLKFLTRSKAFFRRAVIDNSFKNFVCVASRGCVIDSKSWRSCKFCRFEKCLSSGLKPSWVLDKSERKRRHLRTVTSTGWTTSIRKGLRDHIETSQVPEVNQMIQECILYTFSKLWAFKVSF